MLTQIAVGAMVLASLASAIPHVIDVKPVGPVVTINPAAKFQVYDDTTMKLSHFHK
jgi:hypothetical protein